MIPVILSGGSGTRLWPVSRLNYPKQFCEFYDRSFLDESIERLKPFGDPYVLTVEGMKSLTVKSLTAHNLDPQRAIFEPMGKNTAPAIALLCHYMQLQGLSEDVVGVFPADHFIADQKRFCEVVSFANELASQGHVVTLGIRPRYPATGYGYIELKNEIFEQSGEQEAFLVEAFREKPNLLTAQEFVQSGRHYWNAGMFVFKVSAMIEHFQKYLPETWAKITQIDKDFKNAKYHYANLQSTSIDYGIMEKLESQVCIPCEIGWSDVGSWDELARLSEEVPSLTSLSRDDVFTVSSNSNYTFSVKKKLIGLVDVKDLIVVDTPDALLVAQRGSSQKVKDLVAEVRQAGLSQATDHKFETRPWGGFDTLYDGENFKVKVINVDPGHRLSYQSHEKRNETWVVTKGEATVTLDGDQKVLKEGDTIKIPAHSKHRIENTGSVECLFVEVQTGTYFGEDDITRYDDDYGRA